LPSDFSSRPNSAASKQIGNGMSAREYFSSASGLYAIHLPSSHFKSEEAWRPKVLQSGVANESWLVLGILYSVPSTSMKEGQDRNAKACVHNKAMVRDHISVNI